MSKIAKKPITIPAGIEVDIKEDLIKITNVSKKLSLTKPIKNVLVSKEGNALKVKTVSDLPEAGVYAGTMRSLLFGMIMGLTVGFEKKLQLFGVGYRAQSQKLKDGTTKLDLTLGFSHPVEYIVPAEITVENPSLTEIILKGSDKQLVSQVAEEIRSFRPPEPYKGKGIRDVSDNKGKDKELKLKEGKKK
jgi:large subunit ribosomal protein L6